MAFGAFGAHALKHRLAPDSLGIWHTAVQYHLWHALGLLAIGIVCLQWEKPLIVASAALLAIGVLFFSGSLYALALGAPRPLGMVTPLGGACLIAGWLCLLGGVLRA